MKNKILTLTILISSIIIWNCNQDEEFNNDGIYRYSTTEIATLHSMAEKYGIPEVKFITESSTPLPSLDEMEETFKTFAAIKALSSWPMEITDSTEHSVTYRSKNTPYTRIQKRNLETSNSYDFSKFVSAINTNLWLSVTVTKTVTNNNNKTPVTSYSASVSLKLPDESYFTKNSKTDVTANGSNINISYKCDICKKGYTDNGTMVATVVETFSYDETVHL